MANQDGFPEVIEITVTPEDWDKAEKYIMAQYEKGAEYVQDYSKNCVLAVAAKRTYGDNPRVGAAGSIAFVTDNDYIYYSPNNYDARRLVNRFDRYMESLKKGSAKGQPLKSTVRIRERRESK